MQVEVKEIQRRLGVTTIFVTHDQSEALSLSDRIAVMSGGRICQIDTPEKLYRKPADRFVASFIGEGSLLKAKLDRIDGAVADRLGRQRHRHRSGCSRSPASRRAPVSICSSGRSICMSRTRAQLRCRAWSRPPSIRAIMSIFISTHRRSRPRRIHMRLSARDAAGWAGAARRSRSRSSGEDAVAFPQAGARESASEARRGARRPRARLVGCGAAVHRAPRCGAIRRSARRASRPADRPPASRGYRRHADRRHARRRSRRRPRARLPAPHQPFGERRAGGLG